MWLFGGDVSVASFTDISFIGTIFLVSQFMES